MGEIFQVATIERAGRNILQAYVSLVQRDSIDGTLDYFVNMRYAQPYSISRYPQLSKST